MLYVSGGGEVHQLGCCSKHVSREEKRKTTELDVDPSFVPRSLQATDGEAEGGSRLWRNKIITGLGFNSPTV